MELYTPQIEYGEFFEIIIWNNPQNAFEKIKTAILLIMVLTRSVLLPFVSIDFCPINQKQVLKHKKVFRTNFNIFQIIYVVIFLGPKSKFEVWSGIEKTRDSSYVIHAL